MRSGTLGGGHRTACAWTQPAAEHHGPNGQEPTPSSWGGASLSVVYANIRGCCFAMGSIDCDTHASELPVVPFRVWIHRVRLARLVRLQVPVPPLPLAVPPAAPAAPLAMWRAAASSSTRRPSLSTPSLRSAAPSSSRRSIHLKDTNSVSEICLEIKLRWGLCGVTTRFPPAPGSPTHL